MKALGTFGTILLLFLAGCSEHPSGTVRGKVTYKDKPVAMGGVSFIIDGSLPKYAPLDKDGRYEASGVPVGATTVVVLSPPPSGDEGLDDQEKAERALKPRAALRAAKEAGWFPIPPEYGDVQKTPLRFSVQKGDNQYDINLK